MLVLGAVLLLALPNARPTVAERTEYYEVFGSTEQELRSAINKIRPRDRTGERSDGLTDWDINWKYELTMSAGSCSVEFVATTLRITVTLPRWANRRLASSTLAQQWDKYIAALEDHEQHHMQLALRAAQDIQERLSSGGAPTCAALAASLDSTADTVMERLHGEQVQFDRETKHGVLQGARFP
jgi:predicted secreted Zn-dependent protease